MNATSMRIPRVAAELLVIAVIVSAVVTGSMFAAASPDFDRAGAGENVWRDLAVAAIVVSVLGTLAAWALWVAWRRHAALDSRPDAPARLLALAVATLPEARRDWGAAMTAELSSITDHAARRRFAAGSARAALFPPAGTWRPATGWAGGAVGVLGVLACTAAAVSMLAAYPNETLDATAPLLGVVLVVVLEACLALTLVAPPALASSALARSVGMWLGVGAGAGLLLVSRTGGLEVGAMALILPVQLLILVIVPSVVAAATRSLRAAVQAIVWGFVYSSITMFPVYIVESVRRYQADGGLFLDGDADRWTTIGTNLGDAVVWLLLIAPSLLIPVGVLGAALVSAVARATEPAEDRPTIASAQP
jgi:hypothetical protein